MKNQMILNKQPKYFQDQIVASGINFLVRIIIIPVLLLRLAHWRVGFLTDTLQYIQKLLQENKAETLEIMQEHLNWAEENILETKTARTRIAELEEHRAHEIMLLSQENLDYPHDPDINVEEELEQASVRLTSLEDQRYSLLYQLSISPTSPSYRQIHKTELQATWIIEDHIHHMLEQLMYLRIVEAPRFLLREAQRACASQLSLAMHQTVCLEVEIAKLKIELKLDVKRQDEEDRIFWDRREQAPSPEETESRSPQSRRLDESEKAKTLQNEFQEHVREVSNLRSQLAVMWRANETAEKNEVKLARIGDTHAQTRLTEEQEEVYDLDHRFQHQQEGLIRKELRNMETRITQQFQTMVYGSKRGMRGSVESAALLRYIESCEISRSGALEPQYQASIIKESYKEDFQVHRTRACALAYF